MDKSERKIERNLLHLAEVDRLEILQALLRFFQRVERQCGIMLRRFEFIVESRVFFLQVSGVGQKYAAQIHRGRSGVDGAFEALFNKTWDPAAMVKMRVGQDYAFDLRRCKRNVLPIALAPLLLALKHAAIHQHLGASFAGAVAGNVQQMLRSSDGSRCGKKLNVGQETLQELNH